MKYVTNVLDNVRIAYEIEGNGPPLVLVHASALTPAMWRVLGYVDALAADFTLLMPHARGHGASDKPRHEGAYTMSRLVSDIVAILDNEGIDRAALMGVFDGRPGRVWRRASRSGPLRFDRHRRRKLRPGWPRDGSRGISRGDRDDRGRRHRVFPLRVGNASWRAFTAPGP